MARGLAVVSAELEQLLEHMVWADAVVWGAVAKLGPEAGDPALRQLLHHVHAVQRVYLQIFRSEAIEPSEPTDFDGAEALLAWGREGHDDLAGWVRGLDDAALDREVTFPWASRLTGGAPAPTTVRQGLLQVASHSTYHRGQINRRLRELGAEPPLTDFIAWLWRGRPPPPWPSGVR